jgi:hypothetical protein
MVDRAIEHIITTECINEQPLIDREANDNEMAKYCTSW